MPYRSDLDALAARHASLAQEVDERARELDEAKALLEAARVRAKLPILDNIRVATPCRADWAQMAGDDRVRACAECHKLVYNLSDLTRGEAEQLIREKEGDLCVRYFQRADGRVMLADCVVGVRRTQRRRIAAVGLATGIATVVAGYSMDQRGRDLGVEDAIDGMISDDVVMGRMSPEPDREPGIAADEADVDTADAPPAPVSMRLEPEGS